MDCFDISTSAETHTENSHLFINSQPVGPIKALYSLRHTDLIEVPDYNSRLRNMDYIILLSFQAVLYGVQEMHLVLMQWN